MTRTGRLLARESLVAGLATALASYLVTAQRAFDLGDEGYAYLLARAVARGEPLYGGSIPIYPPGEFLWLGGWLALAGDHVQVLRAAAALLAGAAGALLWRAVRPGSGRAVAAGALAALAALGLVPGAFKTLAFAVVALAATALAARRPALSGRRWLLLPLAAGLLIGWREDSAALAAALAAAVALGRPPRSARLAAALAVTLAGWMLWWPLFAARGELAAYLAHVAGRFGFLFARLADPTAVAWRPPPQVPRTIGEAASAAQPLLVALPGIVYLVLLLAARRRPDGRGARRLAAAGALGLAYLPQFVWERPDLVHFRFHAPALVTALALAAGLLRRRARRFAALALALPLLVAGAERARGEPQRRTHPYPCCAGAAAGLRLLEIPTWAGRLDREGGHLIVLGWGPGYYLLEGAGRGTAVLSTFPRHLDPARIARLIDDLRDPASRWVIRTPDPLPPEVLLELRRGYERAERAQGAVLWRRRARDPPGAGGAPAP